MVFHLGEIIGISSEGVTEEGILHIKELDNADYKQMVAYNK